jgi:xanthine dehydrogenase molybdopterin-binding subunit B
VLRKGDFVGVVAANEWDAVRAARQLKVKWDSPPALAGSEGVYEAMRAAKTEDRVVLERGNAADAIGAAPFKVSYNCRAPYQAHAPFGPNCALADVKSDSALVMCSTQDVYGTRTSLARILGLPVGKVRVQYYEGSGTDKARRALAGYRNRSARIPVSVNDQRRAHNPAEVGPQIG